MDGAQDLVLVQARADGLPDLGEQFGFLGSPVRIVGDDIVFEGETQLQRQSYHQPRTGRTKRPALSMRKQDDAKVLLAGLQAYSRQVIDICGR